MQATQPGWYTIMLLSPDESQLVTARLEWGNPLMPVTEPASLRRVVQTGRATVGVIRRSPRGGPEHLFAVRVPVLRGGRLTSVLSAIVNVTFVGNSQPLGEVGGHVRETRN